MINKDRRDQTRLSLALNLIRDAAMHVPPGSEMDVKIAKLLHESGVDCQIASDCLMCNQRKLHDREP